MVPDGLGEPPDQAPDVDSAQVIAELSGGGSGVISLGRYHPAGDMARAEAFGTRGTARCDFLDPAEGERAQLEAVRRQAESFAAFARGGPCEGATGADAIAVLDGSGTGGRGHRRTGGQVSRPELRVGIVGYGMMGKAHCYGYRVAPMLRPLPVTPVVTVMSGRNGPAAAAAAAAYGVPGHTTDWRALVAREDLDVVDICTPPGTHAEIAQAAAAAGKAVLCEKPLALSYPQAAAALAAAESAGVHHAVGFNYRRLPAVALMRRMVADGAVGEIRLWRATWLSDEFTDPRTPYDWRFDRAMGGTTIADLGSHLIDMALWMAGEIASVCAQSGTFIAERPLPGSAGSQARRRQPGGDRRRRLQRAAAVRVRGARDPRGRAGRGAPPVRLHGRGERQPRHAGVRLRAAQRAALRQRRRRPGPVRDAADPGRASQPPLRRQLVAGWAGRRVRRIVWQSGR